MRYLLLASLPFFLAPAPSCADSQYVAVLIGTKHFGTDDLNDNTPGLTFGKRWSGRRPQTEWFVEGGVFYNSYEEISPIALFGTSTSLGQIGQTDIRAGLAIGTAYYEELSVRLKDRYGIPNIEGFIPMVAASLALRTGPHEIRFTTLPVDTDVDFVLNLSYALNF